MNEFLTVHDVKIHLTAGGSGFLRPKSLVRAVDGVSFSVRRGSSFGLVGESGSGKSTVARAVMRVVPLTSGSIRLGSLILSDLEGKSLRAERRRFQMIFQDSFSALNPRQRALEIVRGPLELMKIGSEKEREERARALFPAVGLPPEAEHLFPHQFSGGQRQRLMIARSLAPRPDLVVCDEPVSALDVAIQAQILNLLRRLQHEFGLTYIFISHDLGVVQYMCDQVAVMYLGRIVECASAALFFTAPRHPYAWALMASAIPAGAVRARLKRLFFMEGEPPSPLAPPDGCRLAMRCSFAEARCRKEEPPLLPLFSSAGERLSHKVACFRGEEIYALGIAALGRRSDAPFPPDDGEKAFSFSI
jgi:peptide/nickel transport system ATP-binding protein